MKSTRFKGLRTWNAFQADRGIDFNGFAWQLDGHGLLIDPMALTAEQITTLREGDGVSWVMVTNFDHLRSAVELKRALSAKLLAPTPDRERFGDAEGDVDQWYGSSEELPGPLRGALEIHWLEGGKSPSEPVLYLKPLNALLFADLVRSHVSGELRLLPDPKLRSKATVVQGLQALAEYQPDAILLGDGDSLFTGAAEAWSEFLSGL